MDLAAPSARLREILAEGRGKHTTKEQLWFFHIAMGSLRESQAVLELVDLSVTEAYRKLDTLAAMLYRLIRNAT